MLINQAETAINHFHLVVSDALAPSLIERIRNFIEGHPRKPDWTIGEISFGMGIDKSTVSARRNEMLKLLILERGEKRCCSISGIRCETVRLKQKQECNTNTVPFSNGSPLEALDRLIANLHKGEK